jgi:hypothetical protein
MRRSIRLHALIKAESSLASSSLLKNFTRNKFPQADFDLHFQRNE